MDCKKCGHEIVLSNLTSKLGCFLGRKAYIDCLCENCYQKDSGGQKTASENSCDKEYISDECISKIYGGVLGKIIGVRLGIPVEFSFTSEELQKKYPYISTYLDNKRVTYADDDTNGFVFFAKLFENINNISEITPELVAKTILNYASENRGFFWWGHNSTENKAFHNLLNGVSAYECGNYNYIGNGADKVGGQIFYDAIGLIFGGKPKEASRCAGIVARVMHNGEGAYGGQFICACISASFIESDIHRIIEIGLENIPKNSNYSKMVRNILDFYDKYPNDWTNCQHYIEDNYSNHNIWDYASQIIMALLYGNSEFSYSMEICLKSSGDTDCNCGNLGTILGVLNGYKKISYRNWIKPINDVLYCSSAIPCENEVSITQFTAYIIMLYAKFHNIDVPNYIKQASKLENISFVFPYSYQNINAIMWRLNKKRTDLVNSSNLYVSANEVVTPSGSPYSLKFWADSVKKDDCIRVYRWFNIGYFDSIKYEPSSCTKIYPGQKIKVNVFSRYNTAKMKVCLLAYSSIESKSGRESDKRSSYVTLVANQWITLEFILPPILSYYDCINIEMIPTQDSYFENGYDGIDIYIDNLKIENKPCYTVDFSMNKEISDNNYHYSFIRNFNVCYGEAYEGCGYGYYSKIKYDYIRFYSGYPKHCVKYPQYQQLAKENHLAMAFTGTYIDNYTAYCNISIIPKGDNPSNYECDLSRNTSLMIISAKGIIEHYAVGFYKNKIAILKSDNIPGKYIELVSQYYEYDMKKQYHFEAEVNNEDIYFTICEMNGLNKNEILYQTKKYLHYHSDNKISEGCIGFSSTSNGITVYKYGFL